jgi:hypothetical protein
VRIVSQSEHRPYCRPNRVTLATGQALTPAGSPGSPGRISGGSSKPYKITRFGPYTKTRKPFWNKDLQRVPTKPIQCRFRRTRVRAKSEPSGDRDEILHLDLFGPTQHPYDSFASPDLTHCSEV